MDEYLGSIYTDESKNVMIFQAFFSIIKYSQIPGKYLKLFHEDISKAVLF